MKDRNGIEIDCENCASVDYCKDSLSCEQCPCQNGAFLPSVEAYEARIAGLQTELNVIQESERAEAQEADRLRGEVKELGKKLTETIKLLSERSRECGELEAHNEVLQRRVQEFSMELLDYNMKENKDVLERIKEYEENFDKNTLTQSTESGTFNRAKTRDVSWAEIAKRIKSAFDRGQEDSSVCKTILDIFSLWAQAYECHFCRTLESLGFFSDEEMYRIDKHVTHRKNSCKRDLYEYCAITEAAREIISGNENNKK